MSPADQIAFEVRKVVAARFAEGADQAPIYERVMALAERPLIDSVLGRCGGNQLRAAKILGINRNTLRKMMRAHGIQARA